MVSLEDESIRHFLERQEFGSKGGIKQKKERKCNYYENTLSCGLWWWQNSPPTFDLPNYFIDPHKKSIICI